MGIKTSGDSIIRILLAHLHWWWVNLLSCKPKDAASNGFTLLGAPFTRKRPPALGHPPCKAVGVGFGPFWRCSHKARRALCSQLFLPEKGSLTIE
jgi:hypothetical protein